MSLTTEEKSNIEKETKKFKKVIATEAEDLVKYFFPKKLLELDNWLKENLLLENIHQCHQDLGILIPTTASNGDGPAGKKRKVDGSGDSEVDQRKKFPYEMEGTKIIVFPNGPAKCNEFLKKVNEFLKPEIQTIVTKCNTVRMWVTHSIPKIEDGNNFGVQIQEETLGELRSVESESASFLDNISKYHLNRGQIMQKAAKYPHIDDLQQFVVELDEKHYLQCRLMACELRNHYSVLHDMILKNIEKIKKPRTSNMVGMY